MASNASNSHDDFAVRLVALRPALHRYASRMVGSGLDGEDVVQEAVARAIGALGHAPPEGDADDAARRLATRVAMTVFMRLPPSQRGAVILKDVLGHSNDEVAVILGTTL